MAVRVSTILARASTILNDEAQISWTLRELEAWLNAGQREIVALKPSALVETVAIQLVEGTRQALPDNGLILMDVTRNMGPGGTTPGRVIIQIARSILDNALPDWHNYPSNATVKHYCYDIDTPKVFWVFPPQPEQERGYVEIIQSVIPADCDDEDSNIALDDIYENCLLEYVLYRAFLKDTQQTNGLQRAQNHYQVFVNALGLKLKAESAAGAQEAVPQNESGEKGK